MYGLSVQRRKRSRKKKAAQLNLNSMMDMLTIILVFLLCNISAEEQDFILAKNLKLPKSNTERSIKPAVQIKITHNELLVDDTFVARMRGNKLMAEATKDGKISQLYNILQRFKSRTVDADKSVIVVQADKGLPYEVLEKVMRTAAMAGYPNYRFAVQKE
ncbi:MAG: biopolymer transporter ExbD [Deltaproteobacteria bacterium]|nr:biopolymer transporter ExbD [Deltaproteobacteria bacterium]